MDPSSNMRLVQDVFEEEKERHRLKGVLCIAKFSDVHHRLMRVQRDKLREICGDLFDDMMEHGSYLCLAYAYPEHAIDSIAVKKGGGYDTRTWNTYADEYTRLNEALDKTAGRLADETDGIGIPATTSGIVDQVMHVEDYYPIAVSHRVGAEVSGLGWRGKNELIVHPTYSCAVRLASAVTQLPIETTPPIDLNCGDCTACLSACGFLRHKDRLDNYREQCRRYILALDLDSEVCGKCVKACYRESIFSAKFQL